MQAVTIVTVTHHSEAALASLLPPLQECGCEVIVVDNGSTDGTQALAASFPFVRLIPGDNIGYGRAANVGFREARTPYVLLLNPDVVISADCIAQMLACLEERPEIGILSANLTGQPGQGVQEVDWVIGALMLIRREALHKVGMFDEKIFLFYEETDLCRRFLQAGYRLAVLLSAMAEHEGGTSTPPSGKVLHIKSWHSAWSRIYYYHKHFSWRYYTRKCLSRLLTLTSRMVRSLLCGNLQMLKKNIYECAGTFAHMLGRTAFDGETGRHT